MLVILSTPIDFPETSNPLLTDYGPLSNIWEWPILGILLPLDGISSMAAQGGSTPPTRLQGRPHLMKFSSQAPICYFMRGVHRYRHNTLFVLVIHEIFLGLIRKCK